MAVLSPVAKQQFHANGNPAAGYLLYTYATGTSTPLATYKDEAGAVAHTNPIVLDADGYVPGGGLYLSDATYDYVLKTAADATVWTQPKVSVPNSGSGGAAVATRTAMKALTSASDRARSVHLTEAGREGLFLWDGTVAVATHTADPSEGVYVAPDSGAIGAWVRADAKRGVLVDWFGATPTGPSDTPVDSSAAILAAMTFAAAQTTTFRYKVELSQGVYHLATGISIPTGGAFIFSGQGIGSQVRGMDGGSGYPAYLLKFTSSTADSRIKGMYFYGGSTSRPVDYAIFSDEMKHTHVTGCKFAYFDIACIASAEWDNKFEDNEFEFSACGIWLKRSGGNNNDITIDTCRFISCDLGIACNPGANIRIRNCQFQAALVAPFTKTHIYSQGATGLSIDNCYFESQSGAGLAGMAFTTPEAVTIYADVIFNNSAYYSDDVGTITTTLSQNSSGGGALGSIRDCNFSSPAYYNAGAGGSGYTAGAITLTAVNGNGSGASGTCTVTASGAVSSVTVSTGGQGFQIGDQVKTVQGANETARATVLATTTANAASTLTIGGNAAVYAGHVRALTIANCNIVGSYISMYNDSATCDPRRIRIEQCDRTPGDMDFLVLGSNIGTVKAPFRNLVIDNVGYETNAPVNHGPTNYFGSSFGSFTPTVSTFSRNSGRYQGLPYYRLQLNAGAQTSDSISGSFVVGSSGLNNAELIGRRIYFSVLGFENASNTKLRLTLSVTNGASTVTRENVTTSTSFTSSAALARQEVSIVVPPTGATVAWTIQVIAATAASQYVDIIGRPIIAMAGTPVDAFPRWLSEQPLTASVSWDPALIAAAGSETTTLTVNGARLGDDVSVGLPYSLDGLTLSAWVSAANTVSLRLDNPSAAGVNLNSGTWRVSVTPTS